MEEENRMTAKNIAVVVGYHTYEVRAFQEMLEGFEGLHCYIQHLEQFTSSPEEMRDSYDAVVFYTMEQRTPDEDRPWYEGRVKEAMDHLGECGQGIVVLHHSLLAFENWPAWKKITGLDPVLYHDYGLDVSQRYHIVSDMHPVTRGMNDFEMTDEIYLCDRITPLPGMEILVASVDDSQCYTDARRAFRRIRRTSASMRSSFLLTGPFSGENAHTHVHAAVQKCASEDVAVPTVQCCKRQMPEKLKGCLG